MICGAASQEDGDTEETNQSALIQSVIAALLSEQLLQGVESLEEFSKNLI